MYSRPSSSVTAGLKLDLDRHLIFASILVLIAVLVHLPLHAQPRQVASVSVQPVTYGLLDQTIRFSANVIANRRSRLSSQVNGLVTYIEVVEGQNVKRGDALLTLDSKLAELVLSKLTAQTQEARIRLTESSRLNKEARRMRRNRAIPATTVAAKAADYAAARSVLASARAAQKEQAERVARHVLYAPFDGIVSAKKTEIGEWVKVGAAVFELVSVNEVHLQIHVPQEHFRLASRATDITVRPDAQPDKQYAARVVGQVPVADLLARTLQINIEIGNKDARLLPGASATVEIHLPHEDRSVLVPRDALLRHADGGHSVFIVQSADGKTVAHRVPVKIGRLSERGVQILSELDSDSLVVTRGNERLRDKQAVRIVDDAH